MFDAKELKYFEDVAGVIGTGAAEEALDLVYINLNPIQQHIMCLANGLEDAFSWHKTPQGIEFWGTINENIPFTNEIDFGF